MDSVEFLGEVIVPSGTMFDGTEIGGLSSISYDRARRVYYVLSDDQGNRTAENDQPLGDPVRYYSVNVDIGDGSLDDGDVEFVDTTQLFERRKRPFEPGGIDPEGLVVRNGSLYISSEGIVSRGGEPADPIIDPFIRRYNRRGTVTGELRIPDHYLSNGVDRGVRSNLAFESLNLTPNRRHLITAAEGALFQDGPASSFENGSLARILDYRIGRRRASAEYVYEVGPWAEPSSIFGVNGIVEVLPIDIKPVSKRLLFEFDDLQIPIDNIEGMTFGPPLPDGRKSLVIVSDNNFSPNRFTQFIALALDIQRVKTS